MTVQRGFPPTSESEMGRLALIQRLELRSLESRRRIVNKQLESVSAPYL